MFELMRELIDYRTKLIYSGIKPKIVISIFAKPPKDEGRRSASPFIFGIDVNQAVDSNISVYDVTVVRTCVVFLLSITD
ncbi:hypothetical protein [Pseudanabaena sp. lw0831]|uniref:hypothetical protein n=1 Tax=Pseudanabaena sp. lw0831 TaxID=1357935 RepID=UPI001916C7A5|nr:hypothetical protein [Pseudanabaena sp. lw0831]